MCQSFYCTGIDGQGYYGMHNPWLSNLYMGMASLNNLLGSFGINRRGSSCCCKSNNGSGNGNIGNLLNGSTSVGNFNDGYGGMALPGTNVPEYTPYDSSNSTVKKPEPYQVPIYTCEDIVPGYGTGILSPDIMNLGYMPPVTNPMLSLLVGNNCLNGMDPCQIAQMLMMQQPNQAQQNNNIAPAQNLQQNQNSAVNNKL